VLQIATMFVITAAGIYGRFRSRHSHAWIIGSVGGLAILSMNLQESGQLYRFAVFRTCEVACGVGILICVCFVCGHPGTDRRSLCVKPKNAR
jgi:hypothetical protein